MVDKQDMHMLIIWGFDAEDANQSDQDRWMGAEIEIG